MEAHIEKTKPALLAFKFGELFELEFEIEIHSAVSKANSYCRECWRRE